MTHERRQGHLFSDRPSEFTRTHSHRREPDTSQAAAESVVASVGPLMKRVLKVMVDADTPLTFEQMSDRMPELEKYTVWRRASDLGKKGLIKDSGLRGINRTGRRAVRWSVVR